LNESVLKKLCDSYGIDWDVPPADRPIETRSYQQIATRCDAESKQRVYRLASSEIDEEQGRPGTPMDRGTPRTPVPDFGAVKVRGSRGSWGMYEKHFRNGPQSFDPVTSIGEALASATYEVQAPKVVNDDQRAALEGFVDWTNGWLHSLETGPSEHVREAGETLLIHGPCAHEVVWAESDLGWRHPVKFGYREPSTYDEYVLNVAENGLRGMTFKPGSGHRLFLPREMTPESLTANPPRAKLVHTAYHQRGANYDGVPPSRPAATYKKAKEVLLQIAIGTADKYGMPIAKVMDMPVDLEADWSPPQGTADEDDKKDLYHDLLHMRAGKAPVLKIPAGLDLQFEAPDGKMPTLRDLLEYLDQQISQCFANEGALLGQGSAVGSYALGKVSDDKFVRQAPAVARMVLRPINGLIKLIAKTYLEPRLGERLPSYPRIQMRLSSEFDVSQWIDDLVKLAGNRPIWEWPEGLRQPVLEKMNLPDDALDGETPTDVEGTPDAEDVDQAPGPNDQRPAA